LIKESFDEVRAQKNVHQLIFECQKVVLINTDSARLKQVRNNFLTNAIKYSPKAERVIISCLKDENSIRIAVQDFGISILKSKRNFLFDRLYRVQES
jgi:two-component system CheB/CheR fusion protein